MSPIRDQRASSCNSTLLVPLNNNNKITKRRQTSVADERVCRRRSEPQIQENTKLCELVKATPCLYDTNHRNYGKKEATEAAWKMIAGQCGQTVSCCRKRFRNLRVAYGKAIGALKTGKGANSSKPYYLHKKLDFLRPFLSNERHRKVSKGRRGTIIEMVSSDETGDEDDENKTIELKQCNDEQDKVSDVESTASTEINTSRKRSVSLLDENLNAKRRLLSTSTTVGDESENAPEDATGIVTEEASEFVPEDTTEIMPEEASEIAPEDTTSIIPEDGTNWEPSCDVKHDILLEDKTFLNGILSVMQIMNKRQKHIYKAKIWESVHKVLDSTADYPSVSNTCAGANDARHYQNHSDTETVMQQVTLGIASLNESELREIQQHIQRRVQEIASGENLMVQIPGNNVNITKQEPTSTDSGI